MPATFDTGQKAGYQRQMPSETNLHEGFFYRKETKRLEWRKERLQNQRASCSSYDRADVLTGYTYFPATFEQMYLLD